VALFCPRLKNGRFCIVAERPQTSGLERRKSLVQTETLGQPVAAPELVSALSENSVERLRRTPDWAPILKRRKFKLEQKSRILRPAGNGVEEGTPRGQGDSYCENPLRTHYGFVALELMGERLPVRLTPFLGVARQPIGTARRSPRGLAHEPLTCRRLADYR
jgi:hypothetical protein